MKKTKQLKAAVLSTVVGVMSPLAMIVPVAAADIDWVGGSVGFEDFYNNGPNWSGGSMPGASDVAVFPVSSLVQEISVGAGGDINVGGFKFEGEVKDTSSKSFSLSGGSFALAGDVMAMMTGAGGDHAIDSNITLQNDVTFMTDGVDTLAVGGDETTLDLAGNDLTLDATGGTITIQGTIDGEGNLSIEGDNKVNMIAEPGDDFAPTVTVSSGEYVVSENTSGDVVIDGGVLKGESDFLNDVTLNSGSIEPGMSPGCLSVDNLTLNGGTYEVELNGETVCTEYDSTAVLGDVDLGEGDVTLDIQRLSSYAPEVDDVFAIITYSEDSDVSGYFRGLEDGENVTLAEYTYEVNYDDDDAVTLTVLGTPSAPYTGVGSLLSSPAVTFAAAGAVIVALGAVRYAEAKKRK